jgi:hypothetical protein
MVVAVISMGVVQVAVDQVIDVIAMGHRLMATAGTVHMVGVMPLALVVRGTAVRVGVADLDHMLVDMILVRMMQVSVVQIVDVTLVFDGRVATARAMLVIMVGMNLAAHGNLRSRCAARGSSRLRSSAFLASS